jgi:hypothetical protein
MSKKKESHYQESTSTNLEQQELGSRNGNGFYYAWVSYPS